MERTISRRSLLKTGAALGALAAAGSLGGTSWLTENQALAEEATAGETEVKHSWCYMCGPAKVFCSTLCYVKDGRWVSVEGNPEAGNNWGYGCRSLCAKGNAAMQALYDPQRIEYPMRRVGERGEGKFERCTWDEALDDIATRLLDIKEQYGPEAFALWSPQECKFVMQMGRRFLNVYGSPNYMHSAICQTQITSSREITIGTSAQTYPYQLDKTKLLVNWGVNGENADVNNEVDRANPWRRFNAMDNGELQFIDIRPMLDPLASYATEWVPVRPGTDGALALAILNVIIGEDLYDHDFCENWCNGFDKLAEHVKQFPPEWAAPITGISEEQIYKIARMMGTIKPMGIMYGNSAGDQSNDGNYTCMSINLIAAITGNIDIPGGGGAGLVLPPRDVRLQQAQQDAHPLGPPAHDPRGRGAGLRRQPLQARGARMAALVPEPRDLGDLEVLPRAHLGRLPRHHERLLRGPVLAQGRVRPRQPTRCRRRASPPRSPRP